MNCPYSLLCTSVTQVWSNINMIRTVYGNMKIEFRVARATTDKSEIHEKIRKMLISARNISHQ